MTTTEFFPFDGIIDDHLVEMYEKGISVIGAQKNRLTNHILEVKLKGHEKDIREYIAKLWGFEGYEDAEEIDEIFGIGM